MPITGTMNGSAPLLFRTATTVADDLGDAIDAAAAGADGDALAADARPPRTSAVSCAASAPAGSARRFDLTSASTTSCRGNVASGAKRTGIGQLSPQGIRSIIRGHATGRAVAVIAFRVAMTRLNSFGARTTLQTPARRGRIRQSARPREGRLPAGRQAAVLAAHPAREPPPHGGRRLRQEGRHRRARQLEPGQAHRDARSPSRRRASCCRTSPASPPSSISRRCATASPRSAAIRSTSTRCSRSSSSSTTRCRSTTSASRPPSS